MKAVAVKVLLLGLLLLPQDERSASRSEQFISLTYSTMLGGTAVDDCDAITTNSTGSIFLGCHSDSKDLTTGRSPSYAIKGDLDAFVLKLSSDGRNLEMLQQVGGTKWDAIMDITIDRQNNLYIVGTSFSPDLPVTSSAIQGAYGGGEGDAFVARLTPSGSIAWLTYLGGIGPDDGRRVVLDAKENVYVAGRTNSRNFPTTSNTVQASPGKGTDAFVSKFDSSGRLIYSTRFGGTEQDIAWGLAVDKAGNAHITGDTKSRDLPLKNPIQSEMRGEGDCFVAILNAKGNALLFATYWGGSAWDSAGAITINSEGFIFITGWVHSEDFPVTAGVLQPKYGGNHDAFITAFNTRGSGVRYSTYLGGERDDSGAQVVAGASSTVWVIGGTESNTFPTAHAFQGKLRGTKDGFVTLINETGSTAIYSTYLGGDNRELFEDAVPVAKNGIVLSGLTSSRDFPTVSPFSSSFAGGVYDIIVAKFTAQR